MKYRGLFLSEIKIDIFTVSNSETTIFVYSLLLSPTVTFSVCQFLAVCCFKIYLASFSRYKAMFFTLHYAPEHAEQDQIDTKC